METLGAVPSKLSSIIQCPLACQGVRCNEGETRTETRGGEGRGEEGRGREGKGDQLPTCKYTNNAASES